MFGHGTLYCRIVELDRIIKILLVNQYLGVKGPMTTLGVTTTQNVAQTSDRGKYPGNWLVLEYTIGKCGGVAGACFGFFDTPSVCLAFLCGNWVTLRFGYYFVSMIHLL